MRLGATLLTLAALVAPPALAAGPGETVFNQVCAACHQAGGVGAPGLAPSLVDPPFWQALGKSAPSYVSGVLLGGLSGTIVARGETFMGLVMPAQEALSDADLAAAATYVLKDLNGIGVTVDAAAVAAARKAVPSHAELRAQRKAAAQ